MWESGHYVKVKVATQDVKGAAKIQPRVDNKPRKLFLKKRRWLLLDFLLEIYDC